MKRPKDRLQKVIVIGATPAGIAAVNKLGELGLSVTLVDRNADLNAKLADDRLRLASGVAFNHAHRPGLMRILRNPKIACVLPATVETIKHNAQGFSVALTRQPTFIDEKRCTLCGRCVAACPVNGEGKVHPLDFKNRFSLPGRMVIDKRREPLCRENCPLGVNAQGYVALALAGRYAQALALVRENNILPGICGRICTHPCETACRRGQVDEAVSIRAIKRFLADWEASRGESPQPPVPPIRRSQHLAVIGSGPAGLAAAAQLARHGCPVTVFEAQTEAGGLLRYGIGAHRLPRTILDNELAYIEKMGVDIVVNHPVDLDKDLDALAQRFDGIIVATGAWTDRRLGMPGEDLEGVEGCVAFLSRFLRGETSPPTGPVAVIGDGNAAFDLARTLVRGGADVTLVSWFAADQIPADAEEVAAAMAEGVRLIDKTRVVAFEGQNGRLTRLVCKTTRPGPVDANGIAWPVTVKDAQPFSLEFANALVAIGQGPPATAPGGLATDVRGFVAVDGHHRTSRPKVWAAGDTASGPTSVVRAMAGGKAAADQALTAICGLPAQVASLRPEKDFPALDPAMAHLARIPMPERPATERRADFGEVALGLSEAQVRTEAGRCLHCGVCAECLQCAEACTPIGAIIHQDKALARIEQAGVVIIADSAQAPPVRGEDILRAYGPVSAKADVAAMISRGFAAAAQAMVLLGGGATMPKGHGISFYQPDPALAPASRIGVFVCRCNDSLGWDPAIDAFLAQLTRTDDVVHVQAMVAACVPEGADAIVRTVRDKGLTRIVLGACVCCSLNFVCSACTDQRSRLKHQLFTATGISRAMVVTRNIRGEALSLLAQDPDLALSRFKGLLERSVNGARRLRPFATPSRTTNFAAAVIGASQAAVHSVATLSAAGMDVFWFADNPDAPVLPENRPNIHWFKGAKVRRISGTLGDFTLTVDTDTLTQDVRVGTVIMGEASRRSIDYVRQQGLPGRRISSTMQTKGVTGIPFFYPGMTSVSGLFLADPPDVAISSRQKGEAAGILAAAVMPRGPRQSKGHTVVIDQALCRGCGRCVAVCPYPAVSLVPNDNGGWHAVVDEAFCKGCGNCISVCPSNAADSPYRSQVFFERMLEEILLPA